MIIGWFDLSLYDSEQFTKCHVSKRLLFRLSFSSLLYFKRIFLSKWCINACFALTWAYESFNNETQFIGRQKGVFLAVLLKANPICNFQSNSLTSQLRLSKKCEFIMPHSSRKRSSSSNQAKHYLSKYRYSMFISSWLKFQARLAIRICWKNFNYKAIPTAHRHSISNHCLAP